jgi:hypothetical protein
MSLPPVRVVAMEAAADAVKIDKKARPEEIRPRFFITCF